MNVSKAIFSCIKNILAKNFGVRRANASINMAKIFNTVCCGFWTIEGNVPSQTLTCKISQHQSSELHKVPKSIKEVQKKGDTSSSDPEELVDCFRFYAAMIDRMSFLVIVFALVLNFFVTFSIVWYNYYSVDE